MKDTGEWKLWTITREWRWASDSVRFELLWPNGLSIGTIIKNDRLWSDMVNSA